jgi:hypothetical protein
VQCNQFAINAGSQVIVNKGWFEIVRGSDMEIFSTFLYRRLRSLPTLTATLFRALRVGTT